MSDVTAPDDEPVGEQDVDHSPPAQSRVQRSTYLGTDIDDVERFVRRAWTHVSLSRQDALPYFRLRYDSVAAPRLGLTRLTMTRAVDADVPQLDRVAVSSVRAGRATCAGERFGRAQSRAGDVHLLPPVGTFRNEMEPSEADVVALDPDAVADYAVHTCGLTDAPPRFTGLSPLSPRLAACWRSTVAHVRDDLLADPVAASEPIVLDSAFRLLASTLLTTFPNTALETATDPHAPAVPGDVDAATLREVVDYLTTHAGEPIGPAEIAAVADAPYRDVAEGLRRRRDAHPSSLLWSARLRGAHRDLRAVDPGTTDTSVGAVATRWGFTDLATFTVAYTRLFGEAPERTRRR